MGAERAYRGGVDLLAACRAFAAVSALGSFTSGAASVRIPQSVASRRVAALEERLGGQLLERASRATRLTPFGAAVLPAARRLVDAEDAFTLDAAHALSETSRLVVPKGLPVLALSQVVRAAAAAGVRWDVVTEVPARRAAMVAALQARASVVAIAAPSGRWRVPLGLAGRSRGAPPPRRLSALRPSRAGGALPPRRLWVDPEDDVGHVRDVVLDAAGSGGLLPGQVLVGQPRLAAVAAVLGSEDVLLASWAEAEELGLVWRELAEPQVARGYDVVAVRAEDADEVVAVAGPQLARALGARTP